MSLAIGGAVAGIQGALTGHGFWQSFGDSVSENFVDAVVTSFAFTAVTIAAGNIIKTRCCFKEGTLVETTEGLKPIEEIREGDLVLAYDEQTGEQAYKPVVQLFRNETTEWYHIRAGGEEIICTGGHPFYVLNAAAGRRKVNYEGCPENAKGTWICADELRSGDELLLADGTIVAIEAVTAEKLSEPETTYNFEVADSHTYYVSDCKVLVHNDCKTKALKQDTSISRDIQGEGKYGSYEITYKSGNKYIGKGSQNRMWQSAARNANRYDDAVTSVKCALRQMTLQHLFKKRSGCVMLVG